METNELLRTSRNNEDLSRKAYHKPALFSYGDVRDLTLAPSPGLFESGRGYNFRTNWDDPCP
jgi:hypothetical protein